jgi:hypothetical protein
MEIASKGANEGNVGPISTELRLLHNWFQLYREDYYFMGNVSRGTGCSV